MSHSHREQYFSRRVLIPYRGDVGTQSQSSAWAAASAALQSQTSHNSAAAANVVQNPAAANMQAYPSQSLSYAAATTPYGYPTQQTPQQQYYGTYNPAAYNVSDELCVKEQLAVDSH